MHYAVLEHYADNHFLKPSLAKPNSMGQLIMDVTIMNEYFKLELSKRNLQVVSVINRIYRFRLKYTAVSYISTVVPRRNLLIEKKINAMVNKMNNDKVFLNASDLPHKGITIDLNSTIKLITKNLRNYENELKELLFNIGEGEYFEQSPEILTALWDITPLGLKGWEPDYYYVTRCLLDGDMTKRIFTLDQHKQWMSFYKEISMLLVFLKYNPKNVPISLSSFTESTSSRLMQIPFSKFLSPDPISGKQLEDYNRDKIIAAAAAKTVPAPVPNIMFNSASNSLPANHTVPNVQSNPISTIETIPTESTTMTINSTPESAVLNKVPNLLPESRPVYIPKYCSNEAFSRFVMADGLFILQL